MIKEEIKIIKEHLLNDTQQKIQLEKKIKELILQSKDIKELIKLKKKDENEKFKNIKERMRNLD